MQTAVTAEPAQDPVTGLCALPVLPRDGVG